MAVGKATGLTSNFYKFIWEDINAISFDATNDIIRNRTLTPTIKLGLITLIPKPCT